jgi:hypothetical protein
VDAIGNEIDGDDNNHLLQSKSNLKLMQASISNFAFQTPNPNYYSTLGKFRLLRTGVTSGGQSTPNGNQFGLLSTMVGTTITNGQ